MAEQNSLKKELNGYSYALSVGLQRGEKFVKLFNQLVEASTYESLLSSVQQLIHYSLNTETVRFPYQYSKEDFCLIFLHNVLTRDGIQDTSTVAKSGQRLVQYFKSLGRFDSFYLEPANNDSKDGMYYVDTRFHQKLFYLDLSAKILNFNSSSLTDLFLKEYAKSLKPSQSGIFVNTLVHIGTMMARHYGFSVNLSILATNSQFYTFHNLITPKKVLDRLFIAAGRQGYYLHAYHTVGAQLELSNQTLIDIYPNSQGQWGLKVTDPTHRISWFDIVVRYAFIRDWYLENLQQLLLK